MQLKLAVESRSKGRSAVLVECRPDTPCFEVLSAVGSHLGLALSQVRAATCVRSGALVAGATAIGDVDLRDGDLLQLTSDDAPTIVPGAAADEAVVDLVVVAGPDSGRRVALAPGRHRVGRGPDADVLLADRSMSRCHFTVDVGGRDSVLVADAGSRNGTFVGDEALDGERALAPGEQLEAGRTVLAIEPHVATAATRADGRQLVFNRPPRVVRPVPDESWEVRVPVEEGDKPQLSPALLLPVVVGVVLYLITSSPFMLIFAGLAPATALYTVIEGRRTNSRRRAKELRAFRERLDEVAAQSGEAREQEARRRRDAAPDAARLHARAAGPEATLWERRPGDDDFLELRIGTADLPSRARIEIPAGGDPALREEALERLRPDSPLHAAPVSVPLAGGAIGIVGDRERTTALARWLVAQAAILHSPSELEIAAAVHPDRRADWAWLHWLPHVTTPVVSDADAAEALLVRPPRARTTRLQIVDGRLGVAPGLLDDIGEDRAVIWLTDRVTALPAGCTAIAELDRTIERLELTDVRAGSTIEDVVPDGVAADWAEDVGRLLAPVQDATAGDDEGTIPSRVSLLELLDMTDPTPAGLAERWTANGNGSAARAPVGMAADGPFGIDIGQTDGLRMLLAGMPGTGKSELLQALIASLAVTHPPTRLAFLLVDYKGGAAFRDCAELPHTAGVVTDLDAALAERARVSLLAELRRREALLSDAGVRNLRELVARRPDDAPPALVIVVDEFATLARELPAFVDTVVDVAQRGRSLGLHLVLATQRPRGAVNDAIRANTNLRVAMRVADAGESHDVIEAADAAAIPATIPGRAIALTGRNSDGSPRLRTFQGGYAGGHTSGLAASAAVTVRALDGDDAGPAAGAHVLSTVGGNRPTDLQTIVQAASEAAARLQLARPAAPWLEPLPASLGLDELPEPRPGVAVLGLVDEPTRQRQRALELDLEQDGSAVIYGASGSGKTALLRALACSLAHGASPLDLQIYALDFATRGLRPLEDLPHCGSVVGAEDGERVMRLIAQLRRAIDTRRQLLADGTSRPGERGLPRVVLLLDGYANFASAFERVDFGAPVQTIARLAADGRALGLHLVLTADRRADIPGSLAGVIPTRIVLRMATDDEYTALGLPRAGQGDRMPPGRGYVADGRELQAAWVAPDAISELGARLRTAHAGLVAPPIGRMPTRLQRSRLPAPAEPLQAVIGVDDQLLAPVTLGLSDAHALVAGPHRSGMTTALGSIALSLRRGDGGLPLHLLAPRRSTLGDLTGLWTSVARGPDECAELARTLAAEGGPLVVVLDDGLELAEGMASSAIEGLLRAGRDAPLRLVAAVDAQGAQRVFGGWVRDLRAERNGLLLGVTAESDGELLGVRLPAQRGGAPPPGRGYLVDRGVARLVQVAGD